MMRYFLDMNLPIYFCMQIGHSLEKKAKLFIENKNDSFFLLCDYIVNRNLPRWLKRQKIILFEFNQKIQDQGYNLFSSEQSKILFQKDKIFANRLLLSYNQSKDKKQFVENINQIFNLLQARISYFIKNYIDEVVIPESKIDFKLKSCLFTWLRNDSDVRTIASAIQEHNNKKLTIITADKKDWTNELLKEIHNDTQLSKDYPSLPKIEYLQNYLPKSH